MLLICGMAMSTIGSSYAATDNQQTAENIVNPSLIDENTVNTQNPVETVKSSSTETQNTVQNISSISQNTGNTVTATDTTAETPQTSTTQTQQTTQDTTTVTSSTVPTTSSTNQDSVNTAPANTNVENTAANQAPAQNTVNIQEEPQAAAGETYVNVHGIWLKSEDAGNITVSELQSANITDIFVKANRISTPTYQNVLTNLVGKFQNSGIRIHAWITCFKDANGNWIDPANATQRDTILEFVSNITQNYAIDGIHLDYMRYSGVGDNAAYKYPNATATITSFVSDVWNTVKAIKPKVAVSAALMPEGASNAYYYGQDYKALAPYLDFLVPMIYKGNYGQNTTWIGSTTQYIVNQTGGKPVIAGIQTYLSDYDTTELTANELNQDIKSATDNGASGYALFRYGKIDQDFMNPPSFTVNDIKGAAVRIKSYIETNHRLPNFVQIATKQVTMSEFLRLMTTGVLQLNSGITTPITLKNVFAPQESTGSFTSGSINKTEYLDLAQRIKAFIDAKGMAPNFATSHLGKIQYEKLVYMYSKILNFHNTNNRLPGYVTMDSAMKISPPLVSELTTPTISLDQIQSAAVSVKSYIETNHKLPTYVKVGTSQVTVTDFLRLMLINTIEIKDGVKSQISLKSVKAPTEPRESVTSGNLTQTDYLDLAKRVKAFIDSNNALPNHATSTLGELRYESLVYMYSKILSFYNTNKRLPSYVTVSPWSKVSTPPAPQDVPVPAELQQYLQQTANCQVNDYRIKSLAASLTKGLNTRYEKATKIFNWVRDNLSYSFYYNTRYGAVNTLLKRQGNCVDHSHLLIALSRAAGIPARYVHGKCQFTSGSWYGHVWAQIWANGKWYYADATSSRNTFGVINNWNKNTATIKGIYTQLPF